MSRKFVAFLFLFQFFISLGHAQSLTEAAKKEKERRDSLKGRTAAVATNADLGKVKKKPAILQPAEAAPPEGQDAGQTAPGSSRAGAGAPPAAVPPLRYSSEPQTYGAPQASPESKADFETKWNRAKEWVELLNIKMLALQQQMAQAGNNLPQGQIQKDINDLTQRIQQAQADEKKAKDDLDKFSASQTQKK